MAESVNLTVTAGSRGQPEVSSSVATCIRKCGRPAGPTQLDAMCNDGVMYCANSQPTIAKTAANGTIVVKI